MAEQKRPDAETIAAFDAALKQPWRAPRPQDEGQDRIADLDSKLKAMDERLTGDSDASKMARSQWWRSLASEPPRAPVVPAGESMDVIRSESKTAPPPAAAMMPASPPSSFSTPAVQDPPRPFSNRTHPGSDWTPPPSLAGGNPDAFAGSPIPTLSRSLGSVGAEMMFPAMTRERGDATQVERGRSSGDDFGRQDREMLDAMKRLTEALLKVASNTESGQAGGQRLTGRNFLRAGTRMPRLPMPVEPENSMIFDVG